MTIRHSAALSILAVLFLLAVAVSSPLSPALLAFTFAGLGATAAMWAATLAVLSHGMIYAEVITLTGQSRDRGLLVVIA